MDALHLPTNAGIAACMPASNIYPSTIEWSELQTAIVTVGQCTLCALFACLSLLVPLSSAQLKTRSQHVTHRSQDKWDTTEALPLSTCTQTQTLANMPNTKGLHDLQCMHTHPGYAHTQTWPL